MNKYLVPSALVAMASASPAALVHRYDFETDGLATDIVGTADGTLYGSATITGGSLNTTNVLGQLDGSGLPQNGVGLPASTVAGMNGAFTIELWTNYSFGGSSFTTAFSFSDGTTSNYVLGTPARGGSPYPSSIAVIGGGTSGGEQLARGQYFDNGSHHWVITYDGTDLTYYQDASTDLAGFNTTNSFSATISVPGLDLSSLTQIGLAGGAPWGDNSATGSMLDFRLYDHAVTAAQVAQLNALGANASNAQISAVVPEPAATLLGSLGALGLLRRRRKA
ncbi:LamG-like jellyroll fold domain-containing protein [Haloferula sargassicola]|uniref:Ice-binding protein C-terminal domain-containing protein n=1 Tax=Haloferula sargassicola TaxID=490096 RepID=A0ABP9UNY9_9BACT